MKVVPLRKFYLEGKLVSEVVDVDAKTANKIIERGLAEKYVAKKRTQEKSDS